jgi:hypothetical protein
LWLKKNHTKKAYNVPKQFPARSGSLYLGAHSRMGEDGLTRTGGIGIGIAIGIEAEYMETPPN